MIAYTDKVALKILDVDNEEIEPILSDARNEHAPALESVKRLFENFA